MRITVGHTPDADDAFMFYGMLSGAVRAGFEVEHVVQDIEALNKRAASPDLDVTAVSVHACSRIPNYVILRSGGSFGLGYGPVVLTRGGGIEGARIAVPGTMTSAFLLLRLMAGPFRYVEAEFSRIPAMVESGEVDAGLVIHEAQIRHGSLEVAADLGRWWHEETGGLPVPLGVNVARASLGDAVGRFDRHLRESITYGREHEEDALDYAMRYARGSPREEIRRFVRMYVNERTVEMGEAGEESIRRLFEMAEGAGLPVPHRPVIAPGGDA
ncbi:MAG: ABC transporter substrate-binding protein [Nitrosopumilus sp.]|nr:ABC transporter substrate-binding protein [Nitrosopumilus sp.]MDA7944388.1 ABC transporter substrate-binding protein [Nitrosopumilus sp.]MDA7954140.1 ABC transporter substrate-binding protein [Nitrosopumilus sp.]MDA7973068.1 ABC transporter substrate-binding protein [Nitrosopumilus sp.]MDA7996502.1 ABC transporter substrate-binding protein [Nitrosopumilus sp.]